MTRDEFIKRVTDRVSDEDCERMWNFHCGEVYDYREAVAEDVYQYIKDNIEPSDYASREELKEEMVGNPKPAQAVSGCNQNSYWRSRRQAEDALRGNFGLLHEALEYFWSWEDLKDPEKSDVAIRLYLFESAVEVALERIELESDPWGGD